VLDYLFISRYLCCFMSAALHLRLLAPALRLLLSYGMDFCPVQEKIHI